MLHLFAFALLTLFSAVVPHLAVSQAADQRVALVIGNSAYKHTSELRNPKSDAEDLAASLARLGFKVFTGVDLDRSAMNRTIRQFADALAGAEIGLFFYGGHGIQVDGQNYLVPVDAKLQDTAGLDFELVRMEVVQRAMEHGAKANVVFLDACRDNPLARNLARALGTRSVPVGRGLASIESGVGTLISFSTQPGNVALDGEGRNSPFAGALVRQIERPGIDISEMLINVRRDVTQATGHRQIPWEHSSLTAKLYLSSQASAAGVAALRASTPEAQSAALREALDDARRARDAQAAAEQESAAALRAAEAARKAAADALSPERLASLPVPERSQPDAADLARNLQRELKRVGCDPGEADGKWGAKAKAAMKSFSARTRLALSTDEPTEAAHEALRAQQSRVCPLECGSGEIMDASGRCIARSPAPSQDAGRSAAGATAPARAAPSAASAAPSGGGGRCRDGNMEHCRVRCAQGEARACSRLQRGN